MSNNEIAIQYAGQGYTKHLCACGKRCFPDSIWEPIVKVSLHPGTASSQTWEYHLSCVKKILAGEEISSKEGATLRVHFAESNQRTCLLTRKKIKEGTKCVSLTYARLRSFSVEYNAFLSKLSETPTPLQCSRQSIVLEHVLKPNEISKEMVLEKFKQKDGNQEVIDKKDFDKLYKKIMKQIVAIEDIISKIEPIELRQSPSEFNLLIFPELNADVKNESFRNWLEQTLKRSRYEATISSRLDRLEGSKRIGIWDKTLTRYLELHSEVGFVLSPTVWSTPLYKELQDIKLDFSTTFWIPLMKFLTDRNDNTPLDEGSLVEGLSSDVPLIRNLCLQIHQKRCNSNTHP
jgi:hypothetical protein